MNSEPSKGPDPARDPDVAGDAASPRAAGRPWPWLWLAVGLVTAVAVPALGLHRRVVAILSAVLPLPWTQIGLALLVFGSFAALHFRAHWVGSLMRQRRLRQRQEAAARRIAEAERDGRRWTRVIQENLELVAEAEQRPGMDDLYLDGARAHAEKLEQAFERIRGTRRRLEADEDGS